MVDVNMLFDHTTSNANTTCAAVISAAEWENASVSGGSAMQGGQQGRDDERPSRLDPQRDQAPRDRPDPQPAEMTPQADAPPSERAAMTGPSTKRRAA